MVIFVKEELVIRKDMKTLRVLLLALIAWTLFPAPVEAANIYNRYGMVLIKESNGSYSIKDAKAYEELIGDPYRLPKALVPYEAKVPAYSKAAMETVVPETFVYKKCKNGDDLPLMVYRSGRDNSPVVFHIHGGSWVAGSYNAAAAFCKTLAGKYGITVVSIEYSFANVPGVQMGDTVQDCYDAVEYVLSRSQEFGIDPERVGFVGSSAGGHLSACCAMHFPQTKAYAGWYGAYDLQFTMDIYAPESKAEKHHRYDVFFNGWEPEYINRFSPVKIAETKSGLSFKAVLFTGTADITIGPDNARRYREALAGAGVKNVKVVTYQNVTHSIGRSYAAADMFSRSMRLFATAL